jgi:hypothetical protein
MTIPGKRVRLPKWIHGSACAVHVEVEGVIPDADPSEPCLEPATVRYLDELQRLANAGMVDELAKHGEVYIRRSA